MTPKRFLITGGSHGIGAALVKAARASGHDVLFTGRNEDRLREVADASGAHFLRADVTSPEDNERTVATCRERMGGIDVLVNNAAYGYMARIGEIDMQQLRAQYETNLFGVIDLTNRVVPLMVDQNYGDIVNVASTSGLKGHARGTAYSGSKWAIRGITQCWQAELRPNNIRAICICPSEVQTGWGGRQPGKNPNKLFATDIAAAVLAALDFERRVLLPEFAVFATNPWAED